ncbi:MAG: HAMP domain-containing protein [Anaerolineae bacterium]|nr:HAMP domain-containing protein [Anaerolineae bacterium]
MNRLWVRLTLSQAAFLLIGILLVTVVTSQALELALRREAAKQAVEGTDLIELLGEWNRGAGHGMRGMGRMGQGATVIVADREGVVVYDWSGEAGRTLSALERRLAVPLLSDGEVAGYVLPLATSSLSREFATILQVLRRTMLIAAVLAGAWALLASLLVSESVAAPLRRLATGARALAAGRLDHRIQERGPQETRELAQAFNQMAVALQQAEAGRRELTSDIAHELRTPLTVLQANLSAMLDGVYDVGHEEVAALYDQVLRLNRLVTDLGQLAEFDAGHLAIEVAPADLVPVLEHSLSSYRPAVEAKGVSLSGAWHDSLPPVLADPARVGQVLTNLLSNALRHTPEGGAITVQATLAGRFVEIGVTDTGEGIPPTELDRVFERLYRVDASRSREHGGSGLGLAIARQLVEAMRGTIGATSRPGEGSRFWFRLPLAGP